MGLNKAQKPMEYRGWKPRFFPERMVSALVNGVEGGKWYSLMDKVYAPKTLTLAWEKVRANRGAAGVEGSRLKRPFAIGRAKRGAV